MSDAQSRTTKSKSAPKLDSGLPKSIEQAVSAIASGIGVAATELWSIFVRQYIVRGASEAFTAVVCFAGAALFYTQIHFYALIPFVIGMAFTYGAIAYLGNPKYYALADITDKIKEFTNKDTKSSNKTTYHFRGY